MHFCLLPWVRTGYIPSKMALSPNIFCARALVAQHGEEPRARNDMILEGNRSGRGLVAEITKMVPDAICQFQKII